MSPFKTFAVVLLLTLSASAALAVTAYQEIIVTVNTTGGGPTSPPQAHAAGFDTPALYLDFTGATQSVFAGNPVNINHVSGSSDAWLYCYTNAPPTQPANPVMWLPPSWGNPAPCSDVFLTTDGSTQVLDIKYTSTDYSNGIWATEMATWTVNEPSNTGNSFPMGGGYFSITYKTLDASFNATGSGQHLVNDIWAWPLSGYDTEWDFLELQNNPVYAYSACHSSDNCQTFNAWGYASSGNAPYNEYHSYGNRFTTDGTNEIDCSYIDGVQGDCNSGRGAFATVAGTSQERVFFRFLIGSQSPISSGGYSPANDMDMYIEKIEFWTCANWQATACVSSVDAGTP